jgi:hypothetical protein
VRKEYQVAFPSFGPSSGSPSSNLARWNTGPILGVVAEGETPERASGLVDEFRSRVRKLAATMV